MYLQCGNMKEEMFRKDSPLLVVFLVITASFTSDMNAWEPTSYSLSNHLSYEGMKPLPDVRNSKTRTQNTLLNMLKCSGLLSYHYTCVCG